MKSAAFNLAFKVHRNEMAFPEGLLKAVEASAQEDFIEALNSLAGEGKYDAGRLQEMVEDAQRGLAQIESAPQVDLNAMKEELEQMRSSRLQMQESVKILETQVVGLQTTVTPGMNSFLLFVAGSMITGVVVITGFWLLALITTAITLVCVIYFYLQDTADFNKQQKDIARRKERARSEIHRIHSEAVQLTTKIKEKQAQIQAIENPGAAVETPQASSVHPMEDVPPLLDL